MQRYYKNDKGEMEKYDIGGWVMYKNVFEEIESLRSRNDRCNEKLVRCIDELGEAIDRGDEWKRRAMLAVDWILVESRRGWAWKNDHPEAADWFDKHTTNKELQAMEKSTIHGTMYVYSDRIEIKSDKEKE